MNLPEITDLTDTSSPLKNRIRNNYQKIQKWALKTSTNAFRIYDRDRAPLAIDYYDGRYCLHYFSRFKGDDTPDLALENEALHALQTLFGATADSIYWRTRIKRDKRQQYEKSAETKEFLTVLEYGVKFRINLIDYLDTGLFLDHRETRHFVASQCKGKRLLNLFAYTCSFSVHAAANGAIFTKSVDMSNTYTDWGRENFRLNNLPDKTNPIVRADCMKFLDEEIQSGSKYDIIVIDPPTISRSKKMDQMFDVQIDYIFLIQKALELLDEKGTIFFSTNLRSFIFDQSQFPGCSIRDISKKTLPIDFHDPHIHVCYSIRKEKN
jgi:23S rRNA G2069 N7-methylase RlmK/C1962 C5-methylase RlmI